jgi:hypothetical protein
VGQNARFPLIFSATPQGVFFLIYEPAGLQIAPSSDSLEKTSCHVGLSAMNEALRFFIEPSITLVATFFLSKHSSDIEAWFSRRENALLLKKKETAAAEFAYIKGMIGNTNKLVATVTGLLAIMIVCLASAIGIQVSWVSSNTNEALKRVDKLLSAFDIANDKGNPLPYIPSLDTELPSFTYGHDIFGGIATLLCGLAIFMGFVVARTMLNICIRVSSFEAFKKEIEDKWGRGATD